MKRWTDDDLYLGEKTKIGTRKLLKPSKQLIWQTLAIQVRLIGLQRRSTENNPVKIIKFTGSDEVIDLPNPKCMLVFDSYYQLEKGRHTCIENKVKFSCSCRPDRMQSEKKLLQRADSETPGDEETIYREESNEIFTYHYDRQKGVGKKYNLTYGLIRDTTTAKIKETKDIIPGYDMYKSMFEACDRFNRNLHDKHWPYKRGGRNRTGEWGHTHDFIMACILQNTFSAHYQIFGYDHKNSTFLKKCEQLSDELYEYSCSLR
jgi:hypothetical protein